MNEKTECRNCGASLGLPTQVGYICTQCMTINDEISSKLSNNHCNVTTNGSSQPDFVKFCPSCGTSVFDESFCMDCGINLDQFRN